MSFRVYYIQEPKLMFRGGEAFNPLVGLLKYGPRFSTVEENAHKWLKLGIVGSSKSISLTRRIIDDMQSAVFPKKTSKWNLPFPGLSEHSPLNFSFSIQPEWIRRISQSDVDKITTVGSRLHVAEAFLQIVEREIKALSEKPTPPDVIVVSIPQEIEDAAKDPRYDKPLIKLSHGDDFHSRLKLIGMQYNIPTQLIRPDTLLFKSTQEKHIVLWNLGVGLLYKSQKGYPWKLTELAENTCYVGISFYEEKGHKNKQMRASMAQVFLDTGESFILRGDPFEWASSKNQKSPHLDKEGASMLIRRVLEQYKIEKGIRPARLVIHKSSNYWPDELEGFQEATQDIPAKDFVTIQLSAVKTYREGKFCALRGTLLSAADESQHFLYTTGFVPCLNTYPGMGIPRPLRITCAIQDSDIKQICGEILAFTKLDWNNTFIYRKEPVTLFVSRKVGSILADSKSKEMSILKPQYYYYM